MSRRKGRAAQEPLDLNLLFVPQNSQAKAPEEYDARADTKMLFNALIAYVRLHFLTEEGLMQR